MKAKKSLGQNFLKSEIALRKIIEAGEIKSTDVILEIGPGKGALTSKLLEKSGIVIAVEKDRELFEFLKIKFAEAITEKKLILINDDILKFIEDVVLKSIAQADEPSIANFQQKIMCGFQNNILNKFNYKIIANIPYNITGAILKKFLTAENQPESMILMVQHEVAKRIIGRGSNPSTPLRVKESILSISVKAYGEAKMIMKVDKRYFSPSPKVDSAIIAIKNISRKNFEGVKHPMFDNFEEKFWEIVKTGFAHKRKKLSSNLKVLKLEKTDLLEKLGNKRAEDLTLSDWLALTK
ncbi:MAG: 16S rRNA (adenine(1518)-N(6)/adenine(1519)-N(6))-dimethyltransferase RsmA [Patescibacteria group bacterium]